MARDRPPNKRKIIDGKYDDGCCHACPDENELTKLKDQALERQAFVRIVR
jgi:hypothetical protein